MPTTEQRAFAAVSPNGQVDPDTIATAHCDAAAKTARLCSGGLPEAQGCGWRILSVVIRVEDEDE